MRHAAAWPEIVFFVYRGPRTKSELCKLTGLHLTSVHRILMRMIEEGLVREAGVRKGQGKAAKVYAWVTE